MTSYKLTYFDFDGGRAEPIRIAFHTAGIKFEDNRLSFPEFGEMRQSTRFNSVPVLEIDGAAVTQSSALGRYVGKMAGLYAPRTICRPSTVTKSWTPSRISAITSCKPSAYRKKSSDWHVKNS